MKYFKTTITLEGLQEIIEKHTDKINEEICIVDYRDYLLVVSVCESLNNTMSSSKQFTEVSLPTADAINFYFSSLGKTIYGNKNLLA